MNDLLPPLLSAWAKIVGELPISATPWWLDPIARLRVIVQAAESLGWQAGAVLDDEWDLQLMAPDKCVVIRCVGAGVDLRPDGAKLDVIADAWRILALTSPPPLGALGLHLVIVEPYIAQAVDDLDCRSTIDAWHSAHPWPNDDLSVWVDAAAPISRNRSDTAFPGVGLIARMASPWS
jgi:hypothetical protein